MARGYTVAASALALGVPTKWLDNLLSHNVVLGVSQRRQGIARKLSFESLVILNIALALIADLHLPTARALAVATTLSGAGRYESAHGVELQFDTSLIRRSLVARLADAVEATPNPRRGRPPGRKTGRLT